MDINERNNQIALMLGWDEEQSGSWFTVIENSKYVVYSEHNNYPYKGLPFNRDWNWLMKVVEFINKTHNNNNPHRDLVYTINYLLNGGWWGETLIPKRLLSNKEQLFLAVSDFAKYYNEKQR